MLHFNFKHRNKMKHGKKTIANLNKASDKILLNAIYKSSQKFVIFML